MKIRMGVGRIALFVTVRHAFGLARAAVKQMIQQST